MGKIRPLSDGRASKLFHFFESQAVTAADNEVATWGRLTGDINKDLNL